MDDRPFSFFDSLFSSFGSLSTLWLFERLSQRRIEEYPFLFAGCRGGFFSDLSRADASMVFLSARGKKTSRPSKGNHILAIFKMEFDHSICPSNKPRGCQKIEKEIVSRSENLFFERFPEPFVRTLIDKRF